MKTYSLLLLILLLFSAGCKKHYEPGGSYADPTFLKIVGGNQHPKGSTRDFYTYYMDDANYTWTVPADAQILSAQGKSTIKIKFGTNGGKITVKAKGLEGALEITLK